MSRRPGIRGTRFLKGKGIEQRQLVVGEQVAYDELCQLGLFGKVKTLIEVGALRVVRPFVYEVQETTPEIADALEAMEAVRRLGCGHGLEHKEKDRWGHFHCRLCIEAQVGHERPKFTGRMLVCPICKGKKNRPQIVDTVFRTWRQVPCATCDGAGTVPELSP